MGIEYVFMINRFDITLVLTIFLVMGSFDIVFFRY